jgi:hypothetical protein
VELQALPTSGKSLLLQPVIQTPTLAERLAMRETPADSPVMFQRWSRLLFLH